ncbi:MAG: ABC transporter [Pseudomonadota bacterium]
MTTSELPRYLSLIDIQARMSLRADASRMYLGYFWWTLEPLLYVAVFYLVFDVILKSGRSDFLLFLACGKLPFMWFSGSVNTASNSLLNAKGLIGQTQLPKALFPLARVQEGLYRQSTVFVVLLVLLLASGVPVTSSWVWLIPIMLAQYLLIVPCALVASLLVCVARDFMRVVALGTVFLLFVSGIFWDVRAIESTETQQLILAANPIAFLLDAYRQCLLYESAPNFAHLGVIGVCGLGACFVVLKLVDKLDQWIALRVLAS